MLRCVTALNPGWSSRRAVGPATEQAKQKEKLANAHFHQFFPVTLLRCATARHQKAGMIPQPFGLHLESSIDAQEHTGCKPTRRSKLPSRKYTVPRKELVNSLRAMRGEKLISPMNTQTSVARVRPWLDDSIADARAVDTPPNWGHMVKMWTRLVTHIIGAAEIQVSGRWFLAEDLNAALCRQPGSQTAVDATCERAGLMAGEAAEGQKIGMISVI
ncbi:hypothetical protein C8R45DRAFT_942855 [Mycena sanguinolenta]|nr:hypothetical protein C8R45DRAFT_942855 [Mycena sanguinolenta]